LQTRAALVTPTAGSEGSRAHRSPGLSRFWSRDLGSSLTPFIRRRCAPAAGKPPAASSGKSLSRQFAQWVVGLRYEDLPATVVDRVKGLTLQNLARRSWAPDACGREAVAFVAGEEEGVRRRHHPVERNQGDEEAPPLRTRK
jgi:hypothetical protein